MIWEVCDNVICGLCVDAGCPGEVCEEGHSALQGRPGPAEPNGLHPEGGESCPENSLNTHKNAHKKQLNVSIN